MDISKDIKLVAVGVGKIGMSIVQAFAQNDFTVIGIDINEGNLKRGLEKVKANLTQLNEKGKITRQDMERILGNIRLSKDFSHLEDADVVIESVFEDMKIKKRIFKELDEKVRSQDALLLSNASAMSISEIASVTKRPEFVAGMHFFNPVPVMRLVEVVRGVDTSDNTISQVVQLAKLMNKEPIICKDSPAFIVNRILNAIILEACRIVEEGVGSIEDIDKGLELGLGHPMGPFKLIDWMDGIPQVAHVFEYMERELGDRFKSPVWLKNYVRAGRTGKSSGKGFYDYGANK
ncbi:MAG: 3-hydroxyacyl-CoA dehydrogenase family protein [Syntrophobacteraceae bacterium]